MLDPDSYSVHSRELSRPVGNAGTATPVQSDSILLQDFLGGGGTLRPTRHSGGGGAVVPGSVNPSRNKSKKPTIQTATETSVYQALLTLHSQRSVSYGLGE